MQCMSLEWHVSDAPLLASKVQYGLDSPVARHRGEWPLTALCSRGLTTRRMGEDAHCGHYLKPSRGLGGVGSCHSFPRPRVCEVCYS
jgi:hypothetical protein